MATTYYKRYRMEVDLHGFQCVPNLPAGFSWVAWNDALLDQHAAVKYRCFRDELDSYIFPNLGEIAGCSRLMREIRNKPGFLPAATWLMASESAFVGTIQGSVDFGPAPIGAIQNVGIVPECRGKGLGKLLVLKALSGFAQTGIDRVYLEVTAENRSAVQLYRDVGFRKAKTLYRAIDD